MEQQQCSECKKQLLQAAEIHAKLGMKKEAKEQLNPCQKEDKQWFASHPCLHTHCNFCSETL